MIYRRTYLYRWTSSFKTNIDHRQVEYQTQERAIADDKVEGEAVMVVSPVPHKVHFMGEVESIVI